MILTHTTLHKALKQAVLWGLVFRNVAKAVQALRPVKKEVKALLPEEAVTFLKAVRGDRLEAVYLLAHTRDGLSFTTPKRGKTRSVRLTARAIATLKRHRTAQNMERLKKGALWQNTGLVFTTAIGTPLNVRNLTYRYFRPLLERAGLPCIRFHALRHTFATLLLSSRTHPKIAQEMLGHANISTTIQKYKTTSAAVSCSADRQRHATARVD